MRLPPWGAWLDALLPAACAGCGAAVIGAAVFCPDCAGRLPQIALDACTRCQLHPRARADRCPGAPRRDPLDAALSAVWLEAPVSDWIHAFKYPARGLRGLSPAPLAATRELAVRAAARAPCAPPDLVLPIPLHPKRLRTRGFNPALLLARAVAREVAARVDATGLERVRDTPSQTGLDAIGRRRNLRGAIRALRAVPARVWLVDDVITTGATAREAARALRSAGARHVVALCAARTPLGGERLSRSASRPAAAPPSRGSPRPVASDRPAS